MNNSFVLFYKNVRKFKSIPMNPKFRMQSQILDKLQKVKRMNLNKYIFTLCYNFNNYVTELSVKKIQNRILNIGLLILVIITLSSCSKSRFGELVGVQPRGKWSEPAPLGMHFIHQGAFNLGPNDQDASASNTPTKTVSIDAFWMDDTEITNNEYRQFVYWVKDSIARKMLGDQYPEFLNTEDRDGNPIDPPTINWKEKIHWEDADYQMAMNDLYIPDDERFFRKKEIDPRKVIYEYWWIDLHQAAKRINNYNYQTQKYDGSVYDADGNFEPITNRSSFIMNRRVPIYPDTLCWIRDFTYSYNDPRTIRYFYHTAFDDYPVVGVSWEQAIAFCNWRTQLQNNYLSAHNQASLQDYRLPTEAEWEYAARGDRQSSMYPWGGYYTRSQDGAFMANFKPLRGNYVEDGNMATTDVRSYDPNEFGLYDMAGNVAEWTSNAFDESAYTVIHDFNPSYEYNAKLDDPPVMKRKVIRGGSWKDVSEFLQVGTRSYEYQDSAKSYIGFRCVKSSFCDEFKSRISWEK
jgi:formylglycine-generating enzyme required for sulfatase activity